eukprot:TRINITY_DN704_c0_g1_i1.p1 TRINITY_DN704_c0_g1~~TRINITY_DN704_c0_g1_i1.p1  ORF type:complete len:103 (-),score=2.94 TRINITY_DN704_c0_g1_i1:77-385(-)
MPKSGLKFGAQYVLYLHSEFHQHGEWAVLICAPNHAQSWQTMVGFNRVTEHVSKGLKLCYIDTQPNEQLEKLTQSTLPIDLLSLCTVSVVNLKRWNPELHRK